VSARPHRRTPAGWALACAVLALATAAADHHAVRLDRELVALRERLGGGGASARAARTARSCGARIVDFVLTERGRAVCGRVAAPRSATPVVLACSVSAPHSTP